MGLGLRASGFGLRWVLLCTIALGAPVAAQPAPGYDVRIPDRLEVAATGSAGGSASLGVAVAIDRGLTISRDAALIVDLVPDAGVTVKKRRLGRGDAVDPEAESPRFAIPVRMDGSAGESALTVRVRFWLCTARSCRPVDVKHKVNVGIGAGSGSGSGAAAGG